MSVQNICLLDATIYQLVDDQYRLFGHEEKRNHLNGHDDGEPFSIFSLRLRRTEGLYQDWTYPFLAWLERRVGQVHGGRKEGNDVGREGQYMSQPLKLCMYEKH